MLKPYCNVEQYCLILEAGQKTVNCYPNEGLNVFVYQLMPLFISLTQH